MYSLPPKDNGQTSSGASLKIFATYEGYTNWKWMTPDGRATHMSPHLWVSAWMTATKRAAWPKLDCDGREKQAFILPFLNNGWEWGNLEEMPRPRTIEELYAVALHQSVNKYVLPLKKKKSE